MPRGEPTRSVPVRLTAAERERLEAAAKVAREPLTVFLRRVALEACGPGARGAAPSRVLPGGHGWQRETAPPAAGSRPLGPPRARPAHHPTCKCPVCRPPKPAKS